MGFFDQLKKQQPAQRQAMPPMPPQVDAIAEPVQQSDFQMSSRPMAPVDADQVPVAEMGRAPLPQAYEDQQRALFNPGPLQDRYTNAAVNGLGEAPHGWKGHLMGALQGFAQGGLLGAGIGAISPRIPQQTEFYHHTLPLLQQQADQEMQQQGQARQGFHVLAQSTGRNPITGEDTLAAQQAEGLMGYRNAGLGLREDANDIRRMLGAGGLDLRGRALDNTIHHQGITEGQGDRRITQGDTRIAQTERAQRFREYMGNASLALRREYHQILRQKGSDSHPDVQAFQQMVEDGLVDADGMADNPKYAGAVSDAEGSYKSMGYSDAEAKEKAAARVQGKGIAPKIPVTKLPQYQGAKVAAKAKGGQNKLAPAKPDQHGYIVGQSTIEREGKRYIYRGVNPSNGKLKWEKVE